MADAVTTGMQQILGEIRIALDNGLLVIALMGTLAVPDICAALGSPNGETSGAKYKAWFTAYLPAYSNVDAGEIYKLRCGMLHQGASATASYRRALFLGPTPGFGVDHMTSIINDLLLLDLKSFCRDILDAAEAWVAANASAEPVKTNLEQLVRWYPEGFENAVAGAPILT